MKYFCNIFFLIILSIGLNAQMQTAYWYFGFKAGLDFSSGSPVVDVNGKVETMEGCTSISDEYGNLLFYSDGQKVYDRTHSIMQNGGGLLGHSSSTSSAVVLPKPDNCHLYYLFTIDARERREKGINYNVIDMSSNGGLGAVIEKNIPIPINGIQQGYEKLAAISNADKTGYWIVTHFEGNFYAFPVTGDGLGMNPVISPSTIFGGDRFIGYLKASPDGSKLGMGMFSSANNENAGYLSVYDFDPATGIVSGETILYEPVSAPGNYYGIEFSTNGQLLYATNIILGSMLKIYIEQYDLTAPAIADSKYLVSLNAHYGALQLALDGKIYNSGFDDEYIGAIIDPDVAYNPGTGAYPAYNRNYIDLSPHLSLMASKWGLPTFLNNYFRISINVNGLSINEDLHYCSGNALDFNYCYQGGQIDSIHWDFGDGEESTEMYPQHNYDEPGTYTVTLTLIVNGVEHVRNFEITITGPPNVAEIPPQEVCLSVGESHTFDFEGINIEGAYTITFHLTEEDAENNENPQTTYTTDESTIIWIRIEDGNTCFVLRTVDLIINPIPEFTMNGTQVLCAGNSTILEVQTDAGSTVNWYAEEDSETPFHTGTTYTTPELNQTTSYWIETQTTECQSERQEFIITVNPLPTIEAAASDLVCAGNTVELSIVTNGAIVNWYDSPTSTTPIFTGNPFTTPPLNQSTTYYVEVESPEGCTSERIEITATVTEEIVPEFIQIEPQCYGTEFTLPTESNNGITGSWTPAIDNTQTTTYTFHPDNTDCVAQGIMMTVEIVDIPELQLPDEEELISCVGEPVTITITTTGQTVNWYETETGTTPFHSGTSYTTPSLNNSTTYWVEARTGNCISEREPVTITVYPTPEMQELDDITICDGDEYEFSAPEGFDYYEWKDQGGNLISNEATVVFTQEGVYTLTAGINGIPCPVYRNLTVSFSTTPTITEIRSTENTLTVQATGDGPFEYSLGGIFWQNSHVFHNLTPGIYIVYVRDSKGCGTTSSQAAIIGVPNFISPNGDGYNDTWELRGLGIYPNTRLQIFDRYGKILVDRIISSDFIWDGKYNNQPLPSGSYWYILNLESGEKISGSVMIRNYN